MRAEWCTWTGGVDPDAAGDLVLHADKEIAREAYDDLPDADGRGLAFREVGPWRVTKATIPKRELPSNLPTQRGESFVAHVVSSRSGDAPGEFTGVVMVQVLATGAVRYACANGWLVYADKLVAGGATITLLED
jgi:hypothetical protein